MFGFVDSVVSITSSFFRFIFSFFKKEPQPERVEMWDGRNLIELDDKQD